MKKLMSLLLALAMVLSMAPATLAVEAHEVGAQDSEKQENGIAAELPEVDLGLEDVKRPAVDRDFVYDTQADVASGTCGDDLTWVLTSDGVLTISGTGPMYDYKSYTFPWYHERTSVVSVVIENGVTSIGSNAFYGCSSLTSVTMPAGVTSISEYAFASCSSLTSVTMPAGVASVGQYAFAWCSSLTSITIPDSVTSIGDRAFYQCFQLWHVLHKGTASQWNAISVGADNQCLTNAVLHHSCTGDEVTNLENMVCSVCVATGYVPKGICGDNLTWRLDAKRVLTISGTGDMYDYSYGTAPWYIYKKTIQKVVIQSGVTSVGNSAFDNCENMKEVTIPAGVTSIDDNAFHGCSSLTSITIPDGVTSIGSNAFCNCSSLTSVTIPDGVTSIGDGVFWGCSNLTSVTIGEGVTSIGDDAFYGCSSLTSITLPDGVTSIGDDAFYGCSSLTSITLPDGVTSIGNGAFSSCSGLTSVSIPDSVTSIGYYAFSECSSLTSVTLSAGVTSISYDAFRNCSSLTSVNIPESVTSIGSSAFWLCSSLTSVNIPESVTSIGDDAFWGCSSLTSVNIPESVTSISDETFAWCSSLTSVTIGEGVTSIGDGAFDQCVQLWHVLYKGTASQWNAISIGADNQRLTNAIMHHSCTGNEVTDLENMVCSVCVANGYVPIGTCGDNLTWQLDANGVLTISGTGEMYGYSDGTAPWYIYKKIIHKVVIESGATSVGNLAFCGCENMKEVTIPEGVTSIGSSAFSRCTGLTSVTLPAGVTSIGSSAFSRCSGLTSVTLPASVTSIGSYAFNSCNNLTSVTLPASVTSIGSAAFNSCTGLWHVLYGGTEDDWNAIEIGNYNLPLTGATRHYNCTGEEKVDPINKLCSICIDNCTHEWSGGVITREATCVETGEKLLTCTVCGGTKEEIVAALGHEYKDGSCTRCGEEDSDYEAVIGLLGDLNGNGEVNSVDVNLLFRYICGDETLTPFTENQLLLADVNQDGEVNSTDVNILFRYVSRDSTLIWVPEELKK